MAQGPREHRYNGPMASRHKTQRPHPESETLEVLARGQDQILLHLRIGGPGCVLPQGDDEVPLDHAPPIMAGPAPIPHSRLPASGHRARSPGPVCREPAEPVWVTAGPPT